jgi:hypothetical protein
MLFDIIKAQLILAKVEVYCKVQSKYYGNFGPCFNPYPSNFLDPTHSDFFKILVPVPGVKQSWSMRPGGVVATIRATSRMTSGSILAGAPLNQSSHAKTCNRQMQVENHIKC